MRAMLGLSLWDMARAVGGEPPVVANLEAGAIGDLPAWPELNRIVAAYARLTGVDPQPILGRLMTAPAPPSIAPAPPVAGYRVGPGAAGMGSIDRPAWDDAADDRRQIAPHTGHGVAPPGTPRARSMPPRYAQSPALARQAEIIMPGVRAGAHPLRRAGLSVGRGLVRGLRRRTMSALMVIVLPALVAIGARYYPGFFYSAIRPLPRLVAQPLRASVDAVVAAVAPVREGLTWIDVGDPRLRKAARLPAKKPQHGR